MPNDQTVRKLHGRESIVASGAARNLLCVAHACAGGGGFPRGVRRARVRRRPSSGGLARPASKGGRSTSTEIGGNCGTVYFACAIAARCDRETSGGRGRHGACAGGCGRGGHGCDVGLTERLSD